jgi:hypothetical protein
LSRASRCCVYLLHACMNKIIYIPLIQLVIFLAALHKNVALCISLVGKQINRRESRPSFYLMKMSSSTVYAWKKSVCPPPASLSRRLSLCLPSQPNSLACFLRNKCRKNRKAISNHFYTIDRTCGCAMRVNASWRFSCNNCCAWSKKMFVVTL